MKPHRVLCLVVVGTASSIGLPALLSAQNEAVDEPQVRITLLSSGEIRVSGEFLLETPNREASITGTDAVMREDRRVTDFSNGMSVALRGFVVEADSGLLFIGENGDMPYVRLQDARISRTQ